jgi:hypothetical protein
MAEKSAVNDAAVSVLTVVLVLPSVVEEDLVDELPQAASAMSAMPAPTEVVFHPARVNETLMFSL